MMKTINILTAFVACCGFLVGCSDEPVDNVLAIVTPEDKVVTFDANDPAPATVTFNSTADWTAEVSGDGFALSVASGLGSNQEQSIIITAEENTEDVENTGVLTITSNDKTVEITITQAAYAGFNQEKANAKLAVNHFTQFDVKSLDDDANTVEFCTELNCTSSGWFAFNKDWATKVYTNGGKNYRVPTALEMQLLIPGYDMTDHVYFGSPINNSYKEFLPENLFGGVGGEGLSYFKTSANKIEVGTDPQYNYACYALRFTGTEQRSAYFYRWYNSGSETDAYLAIRIKAVADDNCSIDDFVDNEEYWSKDYIQINIPACGMNFSGMIFLPGASGDYWTSSIGGLNANDPLVNPNDYAAALSFADNYAFVGDVSTSNVINLRLVEID